jgi:tetratricopeptide (TPR) repeat protein
MKRSILSLALFLVPCLTFAETAPAVPSVPPRIEELVREGMRQIYAMDFDGAEASFKEAEKFQPDHPYGYYGDAIVSWAKFVYGSQQTDPAQRKKFEEAVGTSLSKCTAWLKDHPNDAYVRLAYGGTYGLKSRLSVIEKRYLRALWDGRTAIKETRLAWKLDNTAYDALLGIGMYDYYADALPRFVSVFSRMFLGGSRLKGIENLKIAAEKGKYVAVGAKLILVEIYTEDQWGAKDPNRALDLILGLRREFPKSPIFHQIEQVCYYEAGKYDAVVESATEYLKLIDQKAPYYPESDRARMHTTIGTALFAKGQMPEAKASYETAGGMAGTSSAPNRWGVWGMVRLGQVQDVLGERQKAVDAYKKAAEFSDVWGFRAIAREFARTPFPKNGTIGQLPPP